MIMSHSNDIFLSVGDAEALALMLADPVHGRGAGIDALIELLSSARIVAPEELDRGVVAMYSRVMYEELSCGQQRSVTLVYPINADPAKGRISVLSPVGRALLGRSTGAVVNVDLPSGSVASLLIREVSPVVRQDAEEACRA
jgi:regulator of nucleoside diphosphate kinase